MQMDDQDESSNVEDARGSSGFQFRPAHGIGLGTIAVALIGGWLLGINPIRMLGLLSGVSDNTQAPSTQAESPPADDPQAKFVSQILRSTEVVWGHAFEQMGRTYQDPKLLLYRDQIDTACGLGQAAAGPFYCPNDRRVYLDLGFFDLMTQQLGAPGQFAHAYVVAHEVGHHVQNLLGTIGRGDADRGANGQSVRLELPADCYAGVRAILASTSMDGAWSRATSRRRCTRRLKSGMTPCSGLRRHRGTGFIHPRHECATRFLVQTRLRLRQHRSMRYLRSGNTLVPRGGGHTAWPLLAALSLSLSTAHAVERYDGVA